MKIGYFLLAVIFGFAVAFFLSGCITPGIRIQTDYGTIGYSKESNTVTYELPTDRGLKK